MTKRCSGCKQVLPLISFNLRRRSRDGRQSYCRSCNSASSKKYHRANKVEHNRQIHRRTSKEKKEMKRLLYEYLLNHPCIDCGETDPVVLEFDHLREKFAGVTVLAARGYNWRQIAAEIDKCEVVCANCHRLRTCKRARSFRYVTSRRLVVSPAKSGAQAPTAPGTSVNTGEQLTLELRLR